MRRQLRCPRPVASELVRMISARAYLFRRRRSVSILVDTELVASHR